MNAFGEGDDLGAFGTASFLDTCKQNYDRKNGGTVDLGDDHQASWVYEGEDKVFLDVFRKSDKKYNRFEITNCQLATTGGSQCAPSGGGCVSCERSSVGSVLMGACRMPS